MISGVYQPWLPTFGPAYRSYVYRHSPGVTSGAIYKSRPYADPVDAQARADVFCFEVYGYSMRAHLEASGQLTIEVREETLP